MKKICLTMAWVVLASVLLLSTVVGGLAAIYTWVDDKGVTHMRSSPPPAGIKPLRVEAGPGEDVAGPGQGENRVELYTTTWCPWCKKAKDYFRSRGVSFIEYDVEKDAAAAARKRELGSTRGVPFAVVNGQKIQGYSPEEYAGALR